MPRRPGPFWKRLSAFWDNLFNLREWREGRHLLFGGSRRVPPRPPTFHPEIEPLEKRLMPNVTLLNLQPFQATEQTTATAVVASAHFDTGSAADYSIGIDWGDGSTGSGVVVNTTSSTFDIQASHAFAEEGTFTIALTVSGDGSTATATTTATSADAALTVSATVLPVLEDQSFSALLATFTDAANDPATFTSSIAWGDGTTSSGTVQNGAVLGQHSYAEEGSYTALVSVFDDGGATATAAAAVNVLPAALVANNFNTVEGQTVSGSLATLIDAGSDSDTFTAAIDWGDGSTSSGTVSGAFVLGSHTYQEEGAMPRPSPCMATTAAPSPPPPASRLMPSR